MEDKIKIKSISIKANEKKFSIYSDDAEKLRAHQHEIEEFKKDRIIISELINGGYCKDTLITYYSGKVEFFPTENEQSSISINIKLKKDMLNSIIAMCLNDVCGLCEKQTQAFQDIFIGFVEDNQNSLKNTVTSVKQGLAHRLKTKLLGDANNGR
jgi:hypothetical protein